MALLVTFIIGLVGKAATNLAAEAAAGGATINLIVEQLPKDLGVMVVKFVTGLAGLWNAVAGIFTAT
jgi:hypothetical protein